MATGEQAATIPIVDIGELPADQYVGLIGEGAIACLEARLAVEGLRSPIWVRRNGNAAKTPWSVIAGRHRLSAAIHLCWSEIAIEQRADARSSVDDLRRLQVAENLDRRVLRAVERALNLMCRRQDMRSMWTAIRSIRHIGFLGAAAPAIKGLGQVSFPDGGPFRPRSVRVSAHGSMRLTVNLSNAMRAS